MNRENPSLQRDQMKRPGFHKLNNSNSNGFSSPFPFTEFSLNNQSSLNNVLNNISREYNSSNKPLPVKTNSTDPYLKPLSLDRLKSASGLNREMTNNSLQYNQNFIKFSSNNLKNNDFSANFFLRIQSAKTDNISENMLKSSSYQKTGELKITQNQSNGINKLYRENYSNGKIPTANNGVKIETSLTPNSQNLKALSIENSKENETYFIRPSTAGLPLRSFKESIPVALMPPSAKFYVKSFKTDALIYNPTLKSSQSNISLNKPDSNFQSNSKIQNSQNLYLQVKQEVEEYRKQRRKEGLLDINIYPEIKSITSEELNLMNGERNSVENTPNKSSQSKFSTGSLNPAANNTIKTEENLTIGNNKSKEGENNKFFKRPKSVTFNDKVETRDFFGDIRSESEDEESDDASSTENDSHGSIVSTESESEENDNTSKIVVDKTNESSSEPIDELKPMFPLETTNKTVNSRDTKTESDTQQKSHESESETNSKCDYSSESTDTESESERSLKTETSSCKLESLFDKEKLNEKVKCSLGNVTKSRPTSSPLIGSSSNKQPRISSSAKSLSNSEKHHKKLNELKVKGSDYLTKHELLEMNTFKETKHQLPLIFSKFSNVPPVVNFVGEGEKIEPLPFQLRKYLRWRTSLLTPVIVKQTIGRSGFKPSRFTGSGDDLDETESNDWILYFGKHMKGPVFKTIREYQKVNHFPGSFQRRN